jgi:hypothetical protein
MLYSVLQLHIIIILSDSAVQRGLVPFFHEIS